MTENENPSPELSKINLSSQSPKIKNSVISQETSPIKKKNKKEFWSRVFKQSESPKQINFQQTWLNKINQEAKIEFINKIKSESTSSKFKHIFNIPFIITDQNFLSRKKTYEVFTKDAYLELYYLQLKKAQSNTISQKASYKHVISQTQNNRLQSDFLHRFRKDRGIIYNNDLWSSKYYNQIIDQSRLKKLSDILQTQKLKGTQEELLLQFEQYFNRKQKIEQKKDPEELVDEMSHAFQYHWKPSQGDIQQRIANQELMKLKESDNQLKQYLNGMQKASTFHSSTKPSTTAKAGRRIKMKFNSNSHSLRPNTSPANDLESQYDFCKPKYTSQLKIRKNKKNSNPEIGLVSDEEEQFENENVESDKFEQLFRNTKEVNNQNQELIKSITNFIRKEEKLPKELKDERIKNRKIQQIEKILKNSKSVECNSHVRARMQQKKQKQL